MFRRTDANWSLVRVFSLWLVLISGGCTPDVHGGEAKVRKGGPSEQPAALTAKELAELAGNPCDSPLVGSRCMNDEDDIEFVADCDTNRYHAVVNNHAGAPLLNRVPPRGDQRIGVLPYGHVVCVQAIARVGEYPSYLFVTADQENVKLADKCHQVAPARFAGRCAIGWVDRDDMELIDNTK